MLKAITNVGENVGEEEPLYTVSGNADWYSHYRKQQWRFLEKLRLELPHDPDTPLLSIYVKNMKTQIRKDMCSLCHGSTIYGGQNKETSSVPISI